MVDPKNRSKTSKSQLTYYTNLKAYEIVKKKLASFWNNAAHCLLALLLFADHLE